MKVLSKEMLQVSQGWGSYNGLGMGKMAQVVFGSGMSLQKYIVANDIWPL